MHINVSGNSFVQGLPVGLRPTSAVLAPRPRVAEASLGLILSHHVLYRIIYWYIKYHPNFSARIPGTILKVRLGCYILSHNIYQYMPSPEHGHHGRVVREKGGLARGHNIIDQSMVKYV